MKNILFLVAIATLFFYKFFLFGQIPFPGDLLAAEYKPWRTYSYLGYNPGSYPQKAQYFDTIRQLYPWKTFSINSLKQLQQPLWNPHNFSGAPLLANTQSAIFYPLNIFYFLFSQPVAWAILVLLQPLLASIGTYIYAKKIGISKSGSLLSAVAYGYSLFMSTFLEYNTMGHVMIWLPFVLYGIELLVEKITVKSVLIFIASITFAAFAGHLQLFAYLVIFSYVYFLLKKRLNILYILILLLPLALSAIQLIPTFELISFAARAPQEYQFLIEKLLIQPYQLVLFVGADLFGNPATYNYLLPDSYPGNAIYIGIIPFLLALSSWKKNTYTKLFSFAILIILLLIVRTPFSELLYRLPIPLVTSSSPTNMIFLLSFCLSILAGFSIHSIKKITLVPVALLFIIVWIIRPELISYKNLIYSTGLFTVASILIFKIKRNTILVFCLLALTILDNWYFFQKFNPFVPKALLFPNAQVLTWLQEHAGFDRFWGYHSAAIEANIATQYGLYSPEGYDPLYPKWYGQFVWAKDGKLLPSFNNSNRSDANITDMKQLNMLGVKYILDRNENASTENTFPPDTYRLVYEDNGWKIFENLKSLPRVWMVNKYQMYSTKEQFEQMFFDPTFDPKNTVLLEQTPMQPIDASEGITSIISYTPNVVAIHADTPTNQLLVFSDTYYPGWVASIDGKPAPILKANWTFRAVSVPKGSHTVMFQYKPESFSTGVKTSMIGLGILAGLCIFIKKKYET